MSTPQRAPQTFWNSKKVSVTARLIPRYAWTTASIDVFIEDQAIVKTGGVFKFIGKQVECFQSNGIEHSVEVSWGKGSLRSFPVSLKIDGTTIVESAVPIQNWWLVLWPWAAVGVFVAWKVLT